MSKRVDSWCFMVPYIVISAESSCQRKLILYYSLTLIIDGVTSPTLWLLAAVACLLWLVDCRGWLPDAENCDGWDRGYPWISMALSRRVYLVGLSSPFFSRSMQVVVSRGILSTEEPIPLPIYFGHETPHCGSFRHHHSHPINTIFNCCSRMLIQLTMVEQADISIEKPNLDGGCRPAEHQVSVCCRCI